MKTIIDFWKKFKILIIFEIIIILVFLFNYLTNKTVRFELEEDRTFMPQPDIVGYQEQEKESIFNKVNNILDIYKLEKFEEGDTFVVYTDKVIDGDISSYMGRLIDGYSSGESPKTTYREVEYTCELKKVANSNVTFALNGNVQTRRYREKIKLEEENDYTFLGHAPYMLFSFIDFSHIIFSLILQIFIILDILIFLPFVIIQTIRKKRIMSNNKETV